MRTCPTCGGPEVRCEVCSHVHCDEDCMPLECATALFDPPLGRVVDGAVVPK